MCYNNIPKMIMKTFILTTMLFASVSAGSFRQTKEIVDAPIKSWNCSIIDNVCKCPESCMKQKPGETYCVMKDCYNMMKIWEFVPKMGFTMVVH